MRRRDRRLILIAISGVVLLGATGVAAVALRDKAAFFYAPADVVEKKPSPGTYARLGGLVARGTVVRTEAGKVDFVVTDGSADVRVAYQGILPDLFREGQGVVAEGRFERDGTFAAETILARHDENYMPREVADALKDSGQWKPAPAMTGNPATAGLEAAPYASPAAGQPQDVASSVGAGR